MKTEFEPQDIKAIAQRVSDLLKPLISGNGKHDAEDTIFDVKRLCDYLHVSDKWVYERTHLKEIPHLKAKGLLRFRKKDIDKWLNSFNIPNANKSIGPLRVVK